ncbi:hypothetical protein [Desulfitobacterium sp.]|uniref:hypothetical protein n=1 Tax=Desulfitobacterium sp. TaxID=49981 RepID=UPI002B1FF210|nr:hypothetical protein [Desulfitobacterium sp.]MEA4902957.1 hypothetical protein [Desulfitobacterium sp.]
MRFIKVILKPIILFPVLLTLLGFSIYYFVPLFNYDIDNYRYIFSSAIQSLAAIFALISSTTIILFQVSNENWPTSLKFFPERLFFSVLFLFSLYLSVDTIILILLKDKPNDTDIIFFNSILYLNGTIILFVIYYIFEVVKWFNPQNILERLLVQTKYCNSDEQKNEMIFAFEELVIKSISKNSINTSIILIKAYEKLIEIFAEEEMKNKKTQQYVNFRPFELIGGSLARIINFLNHNNLNELYYVPTDVFCELIRNYDKLGENYSFVIAIPLMKVFREYKNSNREYEAALFASQLTYHYNDFSKNVISCTEVIVDNGIDLEMGLVLHEGLYLFFIRISFDIETNAEYFRKVGDRILEKLSTTGTKYFQQKGLMPEVFNNTIGDLKHDIEVILQTGENLNIPEQPHGNTILNPIYKGKLNIYLDDEFEKYHWK